MRSALFNHRGFGYASATFLLALTAGCVVGPPTGGAGGGGGSKFDPGVVDKVNPEPRIAGNLPVSKNCEKCHTTLYKEWSTSAHARAIQSVATVAETNALYAAELARQTSPDPQQFCVNCHSPLVTAAVLNKKGATDTALLPFKDPKFDAEVLAEGIGCTTCHSYRGNPQRSIAGLSVYQDDFDLGNTYYGPFDDPVETTAHQAQKIKTFGTDSSQELCITCHNVFFDRNNDGLIEQPILGVDLVLQTTSIEYDLYRQLKGTENCVSCHMPVNKDLRRVADGAQIGTDAQKTPSPSRVVRSHKFVGVDYPLDDADDVTEGDRQKLLASGINFSAANFKLNGNAANGNQTVSFDATLENTNTGHNFPTGFAFARQTFIEVVVTNSNGKILAESGRLKSVTDDLCDQTSLQEDFGNLLSGCDINKPDLQLVNLQLELVSQIVIGNDKAGKQTVIKADMGKETVIQNLAGGAVSRFRPFNNDELKPLAPFEKRTFKYALPVNANGEQLKVSVKLLFRNLPPYFMRALGDQSRDQAAEINKAIGKLKVIQIAAQSATLQ